MSIWTPNGHRQVVREMEMTPRDWGAHRSGLYVPPSVMPHYDLPLAIDLFCGAGGASIGLHQAGYHVVAAADNDPICALTYTYNLGAHPMKFHWLDDGAEASMTKVLEGEAKRQHKKAKNGEPEEWTLVSGAGWLSHHDCADGAHGGSHEGMGGDGEHSDFLESINRKPVHPRGCEHFFLGDIRNLTGQQILDAVGVGQGDIDLVFGGPPCQGFSMAGKRNVMDPRNSLVFEMCRLVLELQPKAMVLENVPGMATMVTEDGLPVVDAIARVLSDGGFGSYDALRRSIHASAGLGAVMKGKPIEGKRGGRINEPAAEEDGSEPEKPPLLALLDDEEATL